MHRRDYSHGFIGVSHRISFLLLVEIRKAKNLSTRAPIVAILNTHSFPGQTAISPVVIIHKKSRTALFNDEVLQLPIDIVSKRNAPAFSPLSMRKVTLEFCEAASKEIVVGCVEFNVLQFITFDSSDGKHEIFEIDGGGKVSMKIRCEPESKDIESLYNSLQLSHLIKRSQSISNEVNKFGAEDKREFGEYHATHFLKQVLEEVHDAFEDLDDCFAEKRRLEKISAGLRNEEEKEIRYKQLVLRLCEKRGEKANLEMEVDNLKHTINQIYAHQVLKKRGRSSM